MSFLDAEYSDEEDDVQPTCKHRKLANKIEHHSPLDFISNSLVKKDHNKNNSDGNGGTVELYYI